MNTIPTGNSQRQFNVPEEAGRVGEYKRYRMALNFGNAQDIDQMEYVIVDGIWVPVAVVELSMAEDVILFPAKYLAAVEQRRGRQMFVGASLAAMISVPAYYVMCEPGLKSLWVTPLTLCGEYPWQKMRLEDWWALLRGLYANAERKAA